jgi:hypothetical protein
MLITATVRTGNEPTASGAPCGPCAMAAQRGLGDAQPFHLATGVIGVAAVAGLGVLLYVFRSSKKRRR